MWSSSRVASSPSRSPTQAWTASSPTGSSTWHRDKHAVFAEAARVLRPGGRLAIADIITEKPLTEAIVCNADLWASCIGGAAEQETYLQAIESAGFTIDTLRVNAYAFLSDQARNASAKYGVKSISLLATR